MEQFARAASGYLAEVLTLKRMDEAQAHLSALIAQTDVAEQTVRDALSSVSGSALWERAYAATCADDVARVRFFELRDAAVGVSLLHCEERLRQCEPPPGWKYQCIDERYAPQLPEVRTLLFRSATGSGKSKQTRMLIKNALAMGPVLYVSPRIAFSAGVQGELDRDGIPALLYSDWQQRKGRGEQQPLLKAGQVTIISPQSLHLLREDVWKQ